MPIYEYVCQECGVRFEQMRSINEADRPIACQSCASSRTYRAISVFSATSGGRVIASSGGGCSSCAGGSCASCKH